MTHFFLEKWQRFAEVVHFVRGYLAPVGKSFAVDRRGLLGFVGEYATWRALRAKSPTVPFWFGRWSACDFAVGETMYEAKASIGTIPTQPFFTVSEIQLAISRESSALGYAVVLVGVSESRFEQLHQAITDTGKKPDAPTPEDKSGRSHWTTRLCSDIGVPYKRIQRNLLNIEKALVAIAAEAVVVEIGNPFATQPLAQFRSVRNLMLEGSVRVALHLP